MTVPAAELMSAVHDIGRQIYADRARRVVDIMHAVRDEAGSVAFMRVRRAEQDLRRLDRAYRATCRDRCRMVVTNLAPSAGAS